MSSISNINSFSAGMFSAPVREVRRISSDDLPFLAPSRNKEIKQAPSQSFAKQYESTDSTGIVLSQETKDFLAKLSQNTNGNTASQSVLSESSTSLGYTKTGNYAPSTVSVPTFSENTISTAKVRVSYSVGSGSVGSSSATLNSSAATLSSRPVASFTTSSTSVPQPPTTPSPDVDTEAGARAREEKEKYPKIPNDSSSAEPVINGDIPAEEQAYVQELKKRDTEVKTHEQAHVAAGGGLTSGISYDYEVGPDGKRYAVGGSVQIDTSPVPNDPDASIAKARKIRAAALAPASPSAQDRSVASAASAMESEARREKIAMEEEEKKAELEKQEEDKRVKEEAELEEAQKAEAKKAEEAQSASAEPIDNSEKVVSVSDMNDVLTEETIAVADLIDSMGSANSEEENAQTQEPFFEAQSTSVGDIADNMSTSSVSST